jgi:CheY-like chemotaxis protein
MSGGNSTTNGQSQRSGPTATLVLKEATVQTNRDPMCSSAMGESQNVDTEGATALRLLLIDDQPRVRNGLRMLLDLEPGIEVIGEAGDPEEGIALAEDLQPDVVVIDIELPRPGMDGVAATERLVRTLPECRIVILSLHDDAESRARAQEAGAVAFVGKHALDGPLLAAIRAAGRGVSKNRG